MWELLFFVRHLLQDFLRGLFDLALFQRLTIYNFFPAALAALFGIALFLAGIPLSMCCIFCVFLFLRNQISIVLQANMICRGIIGAIFSVVRFFVQRRHQYQMQQALRHIEAYARSTEAGSYPYLKQAATECLQMIQSTRFTEDGVVRKTGLAQDLLNIKTRSQAYDFIVKYYVPQNIDGTFKKIRSERRSVIPSLCRLTGFIEYYASSPEIRLSIHNHFQRVYVPSVIPNQSQASPYTIQIVTSDIAQREIAAWEIAAIFGLSHVIQPFQIYAAPHEIFANLPINDIPTDININVAELQLADWGNLPEHVLIVREDNSPHNVKELFHTMAGMEARGAYQYNPHTKLHCLENIDLQQYQELILLQILLGSQSDLNDLLLVESSPQCFFLKAQYNHQMMPDNFVLTRQTYRVSNNPDLPESKRGRHNIFEQSFDNMLAVQIPALALWHGKFPIAPCVAYKLMKNLKKSCLLDYHRETELFSEAQVNTQLERLNVLTVFLKQTLNKPTITLRQCYEPYLQFTDASTNFMNYYLSRHEARLIQYRLQQDNPNALFILNNGLVHDFLDTNLTIPLYTHAIRLPSVYHIDSHVAVFRSVYSAGIANQQRSYHRLFSSNGTEYQKKQTQVYYWLKRMNDSVPLQTSLDSYHDQVKTILSGRSQILVYTHQPHQQQRQHAPCV